MLGEFFGRNEAHISDYFHRVNDYLNNSFGHLLDINNNQVVGKIICHIGGLPNALNSLKNLVQINILEGSNIAT